MHQQAAARDGRGRGRVAGRVASLITSREQTCSRGRENGSSTRGAPEPGLVPANSDGNNKKSRSGPVSRVLSSLVLSGEARDGHFSRTPVTRRLEQPTRAPRSGRTGPRAALLAKRDADALLGLAPGGVCRASRVAPAAGALLPHRFTLTAAAFYRRGLKGRCGGLLSVALSRALRPVGVTDHPVLWSPDFPLLACRERPLRNATEGVPYSTSSGRPAHSETKGTISQLGPLV